MKKTPRPSAALCRTTHSTSWVKRLTPRALAIVFWLCAWQAISVMVGQELLLVSPVSALRALVRMMGTRDFYASMAHSFGRILAGFALALAAGIPLAALARFSAFVRALLAPLMTAVKATPVASFVILALVWITSANLSVFISFLMVLPVMYENVLAGLDGADARLLEMADAFRVGMPRRIHALYIPAAFPYFLAACRASLGMCWKAGVAAEVIGQPADSIGDKLYRAKLFWATDELFAWTLAIVLISVAFEKIVLALVYAASRAFGGGGRDAA